MTATQHFTEFLESHLATIRPLSKDLSLAWWDHSLTGSEEAAERSAECTARLLKVYANPDEYAFLKGMDASELEDPLLARQHDILLRAYQGEQMPEEIIDQMVALETEVAQEYNNYRGELRGEKVGDNELRKILRESEDLELRREAWEAGKALGGRVADRVLQMVRLRNESARNLGYPNHYVKAMTLSELDVDRVFQVFDELVELTDPIWDEWKGEFDRKQAAKLGLKVEELRPWHYTDPFFQEAPPGELNLDRYFEGKNLEEITARFYAAIGLPIEECLKASDLYEKPGKSQHAFCTDIDREGDVRVLCNITSSDYWMSTMLHEYGHAVYDLYTDHSLPFLLRGPCHTLSTEAIAEMMGAFNKDTLWLQIYAGLEESEAAAVGTAAAEETRVKYLVAARWIVTMCNFERDMYANPDQDLNKLWWDKVERFQGVRRPDNRDEPDWAAKLHLALAPVYYQNYLLGEMVAAQLLTHLKQVELASDAPDALFTSPKVGEWLTEKVFKPGAIRAWEDALEFATGERLNPGRFAAQLKRG